jgi:putative hydrolase of the HAD superfamily
MFQVDFKRINNKRVRGILLDLDNTLYEYEVCHLYALKKCHKNLKKIENISFKQFKEDYDSAKKEVKKNISGQAASHSRFLYFQKFFENKFKKTNVDLTIKFEDLYWSNFFKRMKLFEGVLDFLRKCRKNGTKICLITDLTARIQFEKIKFLKLKKYFDFIVSSEEAGMEKPHKNIFSLALKKLGMNSREVIMVGDDYCRDFVGGKNLKIKIILTNSKKGKFYA